MVALIIPYAIEDFIVGTQDFLPLCTFYVIVLNVISNFSTMHSYACRKHGASRK